MIRNPYHITGPALLSISGGRTSGFMLRQIIDAHGGTLPADVIPVFCNTGLEHEATLIFLREMSEQWSCPIVWLEYRRVDNRNTFAVVDFCGASRRGEPFAALIESRSYLPNPRVRFCTVELKIRTGNRYAKSLGWKEFDRAVGLRYDEPRRVARLKGDNANENARCPIADAKHTLDDVLAFWKLQPFDLMLPGGNNTFGNCDMCFLKGRAKIETIMLTNPERAAWWIEQEKKLGKTFRIDRPSYATMLTQISVEGRMFDDAIEDETPECQCTE